jgi:hypothetical protein
MPRNAEHQKVCHRSKCKRAWRLKTIQNGRSDGTPLKTSIKPGLPEADKLGRAWRTVAGAISPEAFHCAAVPDGTGTQWKRGSFEHIEAANRAALKAHFAKLGDVAEIEANGTFTDPEWREFVSPDGVRCLVTRFHPAPIKKPITVEPVADWLPDDLTIPAFLRRQS